MNQELNLFLQPVEQTSIIPIENRTLLTASKAELSEIASQIVEGVDDGAADPLDTYIMAKKGSYVFDAICEAMKGKAELPEGKNYAKHGVEIREQDTGVKYYYDGCNDSKWNSLNKKMLAIKEEMKQREAWLKSLKGPTKEVIDEDTGEVKKFKKPVYPAARMAGRSLIFKLK
jgi:hypothetical protein